VKCAFFPEDVGDGLKGAGRLSAVSCARSWETCGDSFLDSPAMKVGNHVIDSHVILTLPAALVQSSSVALTSSLLMVCVLLLQNVKTSGRKLSDLRKSPAIGNLLLVWL